MTSPIQIRVDGADQLDFQNAQVHYSMDQMGRTFSFSLTDKWAVGDLRTFPFSEGDACEVLINNEIVIDGVIDDISVEYSVSAHSINITGRSRTSQLVDCAAIYKTGSWKDVTLLDLAEVLAEPFGITVEVDPSVAAEVNKPFRRWAIEDEETVYSCINRAAKMRGLFLISDAGRTLIITKASETVFPYTLALGENVLSGRRSSHFQERFSKYIIKSQSGTGKDIATYTGDRVYIIDDVQVPLHRPIIIVSDGRGTVDELTLRGNWERNIRAGKSRRLSYTHQGFRTRDDNKVLFPINQLIRVEDRYLDFSGELLITGVSYSYTDSGSVTTLVLGAPEAFDVEVPPKKRNKRRAAPIW